MRHKVSLLLLYVCFCLHFKQTHTKESKAKFNYKDSKSPKGISSNSGDRSQVNKIKIQRIQKKRQVNLLNHQLIQHLLNQQHNVASNQ